MACWYRSREPKFSILAAPRLPRERRERAQSDSNARGCPSHAPRDLEEQQAAERDADRPEDEGINDVRHQILSHAYALPMKPAAARVEPMRRSLLELRLGFMELRNITNSFAET